MYGKLHQTVLFDLQNYYPTIWETINKFHIDFVKKKIKQNLIDGKNEGFYRIDIEPKILSTLYTIQLQWFSNETIIGTKENYNFKEFLSQFFEYHLYGIMSYKGVKYYLNKEKNINI